MKSGEVRFLVLLGWFLSPVMALLSPSGVNFEGSLSLS